ncbi:sigma-70 family RNA polymerase sigma factor [Mariniblastus fucicola]|uniref:RNA polymerase sigma factor n=1 Tax=Mariniblastus fucicola TaxID=980251 RepID=A0A5B9P5M2_9BACT|nr:sigma-70 family RNA polymerase sigma factor [Mariniblastus fucicola]QEG20220.1 RNA polymerase sigma factor [Mariniblastus fucicola]
MSEKNEYGLTVEVVLGLTEAQPRLYSYLLRRLARADQAQEVLQNVNLAICKKAGDFTEGSNFMAWAFTVAHFELLSFRQMQARERLVFSDELMRKLNHTEASLKDELQCVDRKSALEVCVSLLPTEQQNLVTRRYMDSNSVKAIAADLGRTTNAISILLHRIRERLLECVNRRLAAEISD